MGRIICLEDEKRSRRREEDERRSAEEKGTRENEKLAGLETQ